MSVKPFLATYVKVLGLLGALTLAGASLVYYTGSGDTTHSASHKPTSSITISHTPSPAPPPTRTASSFENTHATPMDYIRPTHAGQPTPVLIKPTARPTPKPPASPSPSSTHGSGLSVSVKVSGLPRVGVDVSRSAPRTGSPRAYARSVLSSGQYACLDNIVTRESGWNIYARNPSSGAYGLGQALPGSKMASAGPDWRTNGVTQIKWTIHYVNSRYGSACSAWSFWRAHRWY